MSIQSEINRIAGAKSDIADAIEDKGVTVPSGTKLDGMANLIGQISGGSGKLNSTQAADAYDPTATYAVGDKVSYAGNVYSCISAISTPEAWDSTHWDQVDPIQDQVDDVRNTLTQLDEGLVIHKTGDTADAAITYGTFIHLTGNSSSSLPDGLYQVTASGGIGSGASYSTSNLTRQPAVSGSLNTLNDKIDKYAVINSTNIGNVWLVLGEGYNGRGFGSFYVPNASNYNITLNEAIIFNNTTPSDITSHISLENRGFSITVYADTSAYNGKTIVINISVTPK